MTEKKKQLVLLVEGNAALGPHWRTIFSDYLENIIRSFCGNETMDTASLNVELALVTFNAHGCYSSCLVQQSSWTRSVDYFLEWLSAMHFSGGGFCDAAIAEGLSQVLMMFPSPKDSQTRQNEALQKHCILVSASNPYPLPTMVYLPPDKNQTLSQKCLCDAETVAKSFLQSCVSLSVICPRQLPKLKAIYNAGKWNPSSTDPVIDIVKNPHYLVLISENFMEACAVPCPSKITKLPSNQSPIEITLTSVPPVSEPPATSVSPANESLFNQQSASAENNHPVTVKVESSTVSSVTSTQALQTCSPLSTSQEMISSNYDDVHDVKPVVSSLQHPTSTDGPPNVNTLNNLSQSIIMNPTVLPGGTSTGLPSSVPVVKTVILSEQSSHMSMTGQVAPQSVGVNNMAINVGLPQQTSKKPLSGHSKYGKVWEGDLCGKRKDELVFILRLEAFRTSSDSESIAEDWPSSMQIERLISQDFVNNLKHTKHAEKARHVIFRALNQHGFLGQLQERKLCTVIKLPTQTLLLSVTEKASRLIGVVFPGDMVVCKPQNSRQQEAQQKRKQQHKVGAGMNQGQVSSPESKA